MQKTVHHPQNCGEEMNSCILSSWRIKSRKNMKLSPPQDQSNNKVLIMYLSPFSLCFLFPVFYFYFSGPFSVFAFNNVCRVLMTVKFLNKITRNVSAKLPLHSIFIYFQFTNTFLINSAKIDCWKERVETSKLVCPLLKR